LIDNHTLHASAAVSLSVDGMRKRANGDVACATSLPMALKPASSRRIGSDQIARAAARNLHWPL
jgi:hypothetical protein